MHNSNLFLCVLAWNSTIDITKGYTMQHAVGVACFFAKIAGIICQKSIFFEVQVTDILNMYHLCILPWSLGHRFGFRTIYIIINYAFSLNARLSPKCIFQSVLKWKSVNQNSIKQAALYEKYFVFVLTKGIFFWV